MSELEASPPGIWMVRFLQLVYCFFITALICTSPESAWAHAILVRSIPAANSTIPGKEISIELTFNSHIDGRRSRVLLIDGEKKEHALGGVMQPQPEVLRAHVGQLKEGVYVVRWQVLAIDGHVSRGQISFTVHSQQAALSTSAQPRFDVHLVSRP